MFGLFKPAPFSDPTLGHLAWSRRFWRGKLQLDSGVTMLAIAGTRTAPDLAAIALACKAKVQFPTWRTAIENALFQHYEPYAEAVAAGGDLDASADFPRISRPPGVWPHASIEFVSVVPVDGKLATELGIATAWDEEHTLGARFLDGVLVELCGSVLPP